MAGLDFIEQEQEPAFIAKFAKPEKIFGRRGGDSAFPLDRLDQDRRRLRRDRGPHRVEIVEWHLPKTGHHRLKTLFHFLLTRGRDTSQGPAVEGTVGRDDLKAAFV